MAKKKISGLPAGSALNGTELVPIVQTGTTKRITTQDIANLGNSSGVEGSGTINTLAKFTASSTIGNSQIFDNGTSVGINTITPSASYKLDVNGTARVRTELTVDGTSNSTLISTIKNTDTTNTSSRQILDINAGTVGLRLQAIHNDNVYISPTTAVSTYLGYGNALILGSGGAATFSSSVSGASFLAGTRTQVGAGYIADNAGTGNDTGIFFSPGGILPTNGAGTITVKNLGSATYPWGAATFSADATINGVKVGVGAGNVPGNIVIGNSALNANTTGIYNSAVGQEALKNNTTGGSNTGIGAFAAFSNTTGSNNTAIGYGASYLNVSGSKNVAIGDSALVFNTASNNTAVGYEAANNNTSGLNLTAIGYRAAKANTTANNNTAIGNEALVATTTGASNTAIGYFALASNTTGATNTAIGENVQSGNFSGSIILGADAIATANNQFVVGSAGINAGSVATESLTSDRSWAVRINGTAYKILLKA